MSNEESVMTQVMRRYLSVDYKRCSKVNLSLYPVIARPCSNVYNVFKSKALAEAGFHPPLRLQMYPLFPAERPTLVFYVVCKKLELYTFSLFS